LSYKIPVIAVLLVVLAFTLVSGCAKSGTEQVKVQTEGGEETVTRGQTNGEITKGENDVPVYPGAEPVDDESSTTTDREGAVTWKGYMLVTEEPFSKVAGWYRNALSGKPGFDEISSSLDKQMVIFRFQLNGETRMVTICPGGNEYLAKTVISIGAGSAEEVRPE
jgi:hypothetical protein